MGTIVSLHAHPDDESIGAGGTLARAADAGHRVVLVFGTRGELGEPVPGVLAEGEQLAMRRTAEVFRSAEVLGAARVEFLGYTDSGMIGEATNDAPWCFWQADIDHAANRLAAILREEEPDILTIYDDIGGYGHPDHIQVHRVGKRAAELAAVPIVVQGTINRDVIAEAMSRAAEFGVELPDGVGEPDGVSLASGVGQAADTDGGGDGDEAAAQAARLAEAQAATSEPGFGKPESELTHLVEVTGFLDRKKASMLAHESQIAPDHFLVSMPDEAFAFAFGREWYIVDPAPGPDAPALFTELFEPKPVPAAPAS
ncbi:MAG: LmbE family protein [Acidimicrobiales bacterium]|nr:LmbE family protein [Acidimicrobiales bacterium]